MKRNTLKSVPSTKSLINKGLIYPSPDFNPNTNTSLFFKKSKHRKDDPQELVFDDSDYSELDNVENFNPDGR